MLRTFSQRGTCRQLHQTLVLLVCDIVDVSRLRAQTFPIPFLVLFLPDLVQGNVQVMCDLSSNARLFLISSSEWPVSSAFRFLCFEISSSFFIAWFPGGLGQPQHLTT